MERCVLGRTGLEVSRLGFGGIPIQRVSEAQAVRTVLHALERGVEFIDTARAYTNSEERIGRALAESGRQVVLASKSPSRTADGIRQDVDTGLALLGREFFDLYQCHFVRDREDYAGVVARGGPLEGLTRAREEGLVRHVGLTSHSLDLLEYALDDDLFDTIMVCFSFLEPQAQERVIPKALARGVGVIVMKPFSGGVIDDPALALKFVLGQPGILVIPGVETEALFDRNWEVFCGDWRLSAGERAAIEALRATHDKAFCRRCDYCQPCSEGIPIQIALGLPSILKRSGPAFLQQDWIRRAVEAARRCTRCGDCLPRCPYGLPIPDLIEDSLRRLDQEAGATSP